MKIPKEIVKYYKKNHIGLVSTLDAKGNIYSSVKGIVEINDNGNLYIVDLYKHNTYKNIKRCNKISIASVDVHNFDGYVLQGSAKYLEKSELLSKTIAKWEKSLVSRISSRIIKNIQEGTSLSHHEADLPPVKYFIEVKINNIINLAPPGKK